MDDIKTVIYVILGIVYLVSRVNKAVKKGTQKSNIKNASPMPMNKQDEDAPEQEEKPSSFENSLNEFLNEVVQDSDLKLPEALVNKPSTQKKKIVEPKVENTSSEYLVDALGDGHLSLELETRQHQRERINAEKARKKAIEDSQITDIIENEEEFEFDLRNAVVYNAIMNKPYE